MNKTSNLSSKHPTFSKRLFASFVDLLFVVLFAITLDFILVSPTIKACSNYEAIKKDYIAQNKEYMALQDKYELYYYDESSNRHANEDASEEDIQSFLSDENVIKLRVSIPMLQKQLLIRDYSILGTDYLLSSLLFCVFGIFLCGKGTTIGALLLKFKLQLDKTKKAKASKLMLYGLCKWFSFYVLGILTIGIIPAILYSKVYYNDDSNSFLENAFHLNYYMLEKYSSD